MTAVQTLNKEIKNTIATTYNDVRYRRVHRVYKEKIAADEIVIIDGDVETFGWFDFSIGDCWYTYYTNELCVVDYED